MSAGYLPDGLRGWKNNSSGLTYFLYDGALPVAELDSTSNVIAVNTFGANGLLSRHANRLTTFYTFDPQGNIAQRLNSSDSVLSSHMFDAYGLELSTPVTSEPWGFGAQWGDITDRESGLVLMTHRYYDPHLARFLTRDPSGYAAGLNLYAYAGNNPASYADPDGHFFFLITGAVGAGIGAVVGGGIAWWNGDNIWVGAGKGALLGGIAGLTGGIAGEAVAGWIGGTAIANGAISGFVGGVVGDAAQQGTAILLHWRCGFSVPEALGSGALGGVLGGVGGWWADSQGSTLPEEGWKGGSSRSGPSLGEAKELVGGWARDPVQGTRAASIRYHFETHGEEVGAEDVWQYLRKAREFARGLKGRGDPVEGVTEGVLRFRKSGRYVEIAPGGGIVSFGAQ